MRSLVCVCVFAEITIFPRDNEMSRTEIFRCRSFQATYSVDDVRWEGDERRRGGKETNFFFSSLHSSLFFRFPPRAQFELIFSRSIWLSFCFISGLLSFDFSFFPPTRFSHFSSPEHWALHEWLTTSHSLSPTLCSVRKASKTSKCKSFMLSLFSFSSWFSLSEWIDFVCVSCHVQWVSDVIYG